LKTTIAIGCYNEKATIAEVIARAKDLNISKEIIVIDNCSTDGTREILESIKDASINIILQPKNYGAGKSTQVAIEMADSDYFIGPGADLEYQMTDIIKMIMKLEDENLDAVIGSRLMKINNTSKLRLIKERPYWLGSIIATFMTNKFYKRNFTDVLTIALVKTDLLKTLGCISKNHSFQFELVSRLCKKGYSIGEVPLNYKPRTMNEGKTIHWWDMIDAIFVMLRVKLFG
jgi:glycosyltransferase involved in cell wall biosynthesis